VALFSLRDAGSVGRIRRDHLSVPEFDLDVRRQPFSLDAVNGPTEPVPATESQ
jgi:hypothetical protein